MGDVEAHLSVRDVLLMCEMKQAELLAGSVGLDRRITGVNIVEVPDVSRWLRGGELLFTAGYAWRNDPTQLVDAVRDFDRLKVSALVLKLGTYLDAIPPEACAVAEELGFPLIRLPESVAYMDVIDPLNEQLRARRLWMFERLHDTEQQLLVPGLDEQSIERVASVLARQIDSPVYVVNLVDDVVVAAEADGSSLTTALSVIEGKLGTVVASVLPAANLPPGRAPARRTFGDGSGGLCAALVVSQEIRGVLVAIDETPGPDDFVQFSLAHAAQLISFLLLKRLASLEGRGEAMALLVSSLLRDDLSNEEAVERALALGLRLARPCAAIVVAGAERRTPAQVERLHRDLSRVLGLVPHVVGSDGDAILVLVQADNEMGADALEQLGELLLRVARQHNLRRPLIAIGSVYVGLEGLRRSRSEAMIAYQTGSRVGIGGIVHFANLGVERLLAQIPPSELTVQYLRSAIGAIESDPELVRTLQVYVESGGRKVVTAKKLPLHRSSLEYRLEKIAKMLGVDLTLPERQLELWLALRLRQVYALSIPARPGGIIARGSLPSRVGTETRPVTDS